MKVRVISSLICAVAVISVLSGCQSVFKQELKQAKTGNYTAQGRVAVCYLKGYQTPVDYRKAFEWASKAAAMEDPCGYYVLGQLYSTGLGNIRVDLDKADKYYRQALSGFQIISRNDGTAEDCLLAEMYLYGLGSEKRPASALFLLNRCAWRYPPASCLLGIMYRDGTGVKKDINRAARDFLFAAEKKMPEGQYYLGQIYENESKRYDVAAKWYREAAALNYPPAMYQLGLLLEGNKISALSGETPASLYQKAAASGYAPAINKVALDIARINPDGAVSLLWTAVSRNYTPAMVELGKILENHDYPVTAMQLFIMAHKLGNADAVDPLVTLDGKTGYFLPVSFTQRRFTHGADLVKYKSSIKRILAGYKAGLPEGSLKVFAKALEADPEEFYLSCDWLRFFAAKIPPAPAGDIFKAVLSKHFDDPGFWFNYASCATAAGQFEAAMYGADQIKKNADSDPDKELLLNLAAVIKMNALIGLGRDKDAYIHIFANGLIKRNTLSIARYVNNWTPLALKNKKQFSVATGIGMDLLGETKKAPERQKFFDAESGQSVLNPGVIPEPQLKFNFSSDKTSKK